MVVRPVFLKALAATVVGAVCLVAAINIFGNAQGEPCRDSYSCKGFLLSGVECVVEGDDAYCTVYCDTDKDCPADWRCRSAEPTALGIETNTLDEVCLRP
jgi:hypothetical protein